MAMLYVGASPDSLAPVPQDPSSWTYGLQDVSSSDAGRVHDAGNRMYKMRTSQKRKLNLSWDMPTPEVVSQLLRLFNEEYFYVRYLDAMDNEWQVRQFYAGDRSAPLKSWSTALKRYQTLSFDIIEV